MRIEERRTLALLGCHTMGCCIPTQRCSFITRKVKHLLDALKSVLECLVFAEEELSPRATIL